MHVRRLICALVFAGLAAAAAGAQLERKVNARARVFPEIGPGVQAMKRDAAGRYFILAPRSPLLVFSADGKRVGQIPAPPAAVAGAAGKPDPAAGPDLLYAEDFDLAPDGRVYVADRGAGAIKVYSPQGALERTIPAAAPNSVAVLADGEIAVTSSAPGGARGPLRRLVTVFNAQGKLVREFANPVDLAERREVNHLLGFGRILSDAHSNIYYAYTYLPEPTLRKFDRFGYEALTIEQASLDYQAVAQAARREIAVQDRKGGNPSLRPVVLAHALDPSTQEIWLAVGNELLQFDGEGNRRGTYRIYTPDGVRLEPSAMIIEPDRVLVASESLGIFELPRPDKTSR